MQQGRTAMPATVWKGSISFGLVTFPVKLYSAARAETVHFHLLHKKDLSRVKEAWFCAKEDKRIDRSDIVKGYEKSKDKYVVIEDEELKQIAPPTASAMEILQFVRKGEVDPIHYESSYYVAPGEDGAKPYALFANALEDTKHEAIAKIAMHTREHIVLIRPYEGTLLLHTLYFADELRSANKTPAPKTKYSSKELQLAKSLVDHLRAPFKVEKFHDTYRENVERLIREKSKGREITVAPEPARAPVIDLMEALKKSLATKHSAANHLPKKRRAA
jgi:DNA end-binding protein Ku